MVQFVGKYEYESGENFDEFLKALGVGFIIRNLAKTSKPTIEISLADDGTYTIKTITTLKTTEIKFKLGEEFEETRMDGAKVKVSVLCPMTSGSEGVHGLLVVASVSRGS